MDTMGIISVPHSEARQHYRAADDHPGVPSRVIVPHLTQSFGSRGRWPALTAKAERSHQKRLFSSKSYNLQLKIRSTSFDSSSKVALLSSTSQNLITGMAVTDEGRTGIEGQCPHKRKHAQRLAHMAQ